MYIVFTLLEVLPNFAANAERVKRANDQQLYFTRHNMNFEHYISRSLLFLEARSIERKTRYDFVQVRVREPLTTI